ncbi:hypothetical protein [Christiangramia forsetii]|uniref:Membrane or secreted protein n=2 Tax=Christiangramia forsetii TaxID=411153 RepID=A0M621_CHRFK|nr:hypothetical protein [Christiangramia forsetii]GGG31606.1 hypothetical protein GCM10011532_13880 [Christiangramia forsetii]CAL68066.1 membrane or secreted protein [Christiangramia forsetii KT0803]
MKKIFILSILLFSASLFSQSLTGSWKLVEENGKEVSDKEVVRVYQDSYFAEGAKKAGTNEFLWALGGEFTNDDYTTTLDFNTKSPEMIGELQDPKLSFQGENKIQINNVTEVQVWERISTNENDLNGNWVITGRKRDGNMNKMKPGDRRTIKILSGDRFQWVAFNSATREFSGTGGGTYSAENGKYTEHIEFFSRDDSRVGADLSFDYEVKNGEWHHSGKSSKGNPIYEIWSPYEEAYSK